MNTTQPLPPVLHKSMRVVVEHEIVVLNPG
jgi:hypothetical protein